MSEVTVKKFGDLEGYQGLFLHAAKGLGVTSWGMNLLKLPPQWADYPDHDHVTDGQEEVYVVISGAATLQAGDESWDLTPGMLARVGPDQKRKIIPGDEGVTLLALGGTPGKAYEPSQ
jgi:mannose-6-phosphate isomerase-like protein (cupin superfamily)